jgi:hypothetical protein
MASFGEGLISGFTAVYGTMARASLQREQAAYFRNQREGAEEFQRRGRELQRELGIDPNATVRAPQAAPAPEGAPQEQGSAPAATPQPQQGAVQGALAGAPAQAAPTPSQAPATTPQAPVQTGVAGSGGPSQRPPVSPEDFERAANSGDPVLMATAAGVVAGSQGNVPGQTGDTRGPQQLVSEVAAANGGVRGPLTRQHWNTYYERRINDAMELLPPDQAVRVVGMLDQQRQRGFGQMISLAVAAAEAGDAQGATWALFGASNFMPDGFKDDFRVAANGRAIEIIRTPESGQGETQRMTVPLDQVSRYATTMLDPKWSMTHQLQVRQLDESSRAARAREGLQAADLTLRREEREERRRIDLNSGEAIESASRVARAEVEYDSAVRSGNQERIDAALEKLNTEESRDADLVGRGLNTRGAAGRTQAATAVRNAATRREVADARIARFTDMTQLARDSLSLREEDRAAARTQAAERLSQYDRGLDIRALSVELRNDVARSRIALSQARNEDDKRVAEERLRIAEERLNLAVRTQNRREGDESRVTPQTRTETDRALDAYTSTRPQNSTVPIDMLERFALPTVAANPRMLAGASIRMLDQFMTTPNNFVLAPDFSQIRPKAGGPSLNISPEMRDYLQSQRPRANEGGSAAPAAPAAPAASGTSRSPSSMQRPAPQDEGAGQSALNRSLGRTAPAPGQRTAAPTSRPSAARPQSVDAWISQNAPAEARGAIPDRELQKAASRYNVPVTELRRRMREWNQAEIPRGL